MLEIRWIFGNVDGWQVSLSYDRLGEADLAIACADSGLESLGHNLCENFRDVHPCSQRTAFYIFFKMFLLCFHVFPEEFMSLLLSVSWKDSQTLLRGSWSASFVATCDGSFDFFVFAPGGSFAGNILFNVLQSTTQVHQSKFWKVQVR